MQVLSVVHGGGVRAGVFADELRDRGHRLVEWPVPTMARPPQTLASYDAVIVFGGSMHVDQEHEHAWLRGELELLDELLGSETPVLGVCLGAQLLAKAAGAWVGAVEQPEIGWFPVELTPAGNDDPVLGTMPRSLDAFQWHYYGFDVPAGGVELARNDAGTQAFRLDESVWGVQFHPEVTLAQVESWIDDPDDPCPDPEALRAETRLKIDEWNAVGRTLCGAFLDAAEALRVA